MLNRLARPWRRIALRPMKPVPSIKQRADRKLRSGATLNDRDRSLVMILKLWVSESHNALDDGL